MFPQNIFLLKYITSFILGDKPVVCNICGKRFGNDRQMRSHFKIHKEPRLEEFGTLARRSRPHRDIVSSHSGSSMTTISSFHQIPQIANESQLSVSKNSFGTNHTFVVNSNNIKRISEQNSPFNWQVPRKETLMKLPDISYSIHTTKQQNEFSQSASKENALAPHVRKLPPIQKVPHFDPGNISVIDSVMGVSKAIETNKKSGFTEKAEYQLIKARLDEISLASRPSTRQTFSRNQPLSPDLGKPSIGQFKDSQDGRSSHTAGRTSDASGYFQYFRENSNPIVQKSAFSLPRLR